MKKLRININKLQTEKTIKNKVLTIQYLEFLMLSTKTSNFVGGLFSILEIRFCSSFMLIVLLEMGLLQLGQ